MKEYEDQKYSQWRDETEQMLPELMENTLLNVVYCEAATHVNRETSEQVRYRMMVLSFFSVGKNSNPSNDQ